MSNKGFFSSSRSALDKSLNTNPKMFSLCLSFNSSQFSRASWIYWKALPCVPEVFHNSQCSQFSTAYGHSCCVPRLFDSIEPSATLNLLHLFTVFLEVLSGWVQPSIVYYKEFSFAFCKWCVCMYFHNQN